MISLSQAIILSIVQSITEWLPVSSSGHLVLLQSILGVKNFAFDMHLHLASVLAIIFVFWKDLIKLTHLKDKSVQKYLGYLLIGIFPVGIIGVLFKDFFESFFTNTIYLGLFFILSGLIIISTKFVGQKKYEISWKNSLFIGLIQMLAILPGVSRSGSSISAGLISGLKKEEAIKFSFLMAVPIILGATLISFKDIINSQINFTILLTSFIITFFVSILAIKLLLAVIRKQKFYWFGIYNLVLGIIVLLFI